MLLLRRARRVLCGGSLGSVPGGDAVDYHRSEPQQRRAADREPLERNSRQAPRALHGGVCDPGPGRGAQTRGSDESRSALARVRGDLDAGEVGGDGERRAAAAFLALAATSSDRDHERQRGSVEGPCEPRRTLERVRGGVGGARGERRSEGRGARERVRRRRREEGSAVSVVFVEVEVEVAARVPSGERRRAQVQRQVILFP